MSTCFGEKIADFSEIFTIIQFCTKIQIKILYGLKLYIRRSSKISIFILRYRRVLGIFYECLINRSLSYLNGFLNYKYIRVLKIMHII